MGVCQQDLVQHTSVYVFKSVVGQVTTEEEVLTPGPDGRLISTDERMQQVRQAQSESPAPASTDGELYVLSAVCCIHMLFSVMSF